MAKHALLAASSAERWLNCTPSARLSEKMEEPESPYAAEGTLAHSIGELLIRKGLRRISDKAFKSQMRKLENHDMFYAGMVDEVEEYANYVLETYYEAVSKTKDAVIFLEERLDFSRYVPEGFGTGDCIIIADGEMEIIDLKFGKGIEVSPIKNAQLMFYALGAFDKYGWIYGVDLIRMTIAQIRLGNIASWTINVPMLEEWAANIKPIAIMAFEGRGELNPGPWCQFCLAKAACKARAEQNIKLYQHYNRDPNLLTVDEIGEILHKADAIEKWAKDLKEYALNEALKGTKYPGWKLVEGRSNRQIDDEAELAKRLIAEGYDEDKIYKPKTLEGITNLEKLIGKKRFSEIADGLISKPSGKPTLVPEDDKRPELDSVEQDFF